MLIKEEEDVEDLKKSLKKDKKKQPTLKLQPYIDDFWAGEMISAAQHVVVLVSDSSFCVASILLFFIWISAAKVNPKQAVIFLLSFCIFFLSFLPFIATFSILWNVDVLLVDTVHEW